MPLENLTTFHQSLPTIAIVSLAIWSLVWKGLALWKSSRLNKPIWFIVLLVVNTLGILEILYIFIFSKMGGKKSERKIQKTPKRHSHKRS